MQALKGLVGGLGILIVIGMSVIGYGLYRKSTDPGFSFFTSDKQSLTTAPDAPPAIIPTVPTVPTAPTGPVAAFGEIMVGLPKDCAIEGVSGDGSRIFLRVGPATPDCSRVVILNAATGAQIGLIRIAP